MRTFEYQALNHQGKTVKGIIEADSLRAVRQQLRDRNLLAIDIEPVSRISSNSSHKAGLSQIRWLKAHIKMQDLMMLTRQLATLISSGMPLEASLSLIGQQAEQTRIKKVVSSIRTGIAEGHSFAIALQQASMIFPAEYIATIAAAEETGHLDKVLERLADDVEVQQQTQQSLSSALVYPLVMVLVAVTVIVLLMIYIVPKVTEVFRARDQVLPLLTRILISLSDFLTNYGVLVLLVGIGLVILFLLALRKPEFLLQFHKRMLGLPLAGRWIMAANLSRWARSLSMLMQSGVPSLESLKIARESVHNTYLKNGLIQAHAMVREGKSLHKALQATQIFPGFMIHMIAGGEASGNLHYMLLKISDYYAQNLRLSTQMALKLLEPLLILVMGGVVLVIVLAILMPIFAMNALVL